jgi:hypothetical protein
MTKLLKLLEIILETRPVRSVISWALRTLSLAAWLAIAAAIVALLAAILTMWFLRRTRPGRRVAVVRHWLVKRPVHALRRRL